MTKILNLDVVAPEVGRELVLRGKTYKVREMSVEDFIETSEEAEKLAGETSIPVQMRASIKMIKRFVPEMEDSVLNSMKLPQLMAMSAFVRGEDPAGTTETEEAGKA